ncbi:MAG: tetratricopeptide repeat protein [Bdellovibrionia bacterium]
MNKSSSGKSRLLPSWVVGLLAVMTLLLFANSWQNPLILDDLVKVVNNSDIRNMDRIGDTLIYPYGATPTRNRNDPSRPLVSLVHTVVYHFWSAHPVPYHIVNTVIHFGNGILVFLLISFFSKNIYASLSMALLFLLLPIQAGVAIYVYSLSDLLSSFFILLAFYSFVRRKSEPAISSEVQQGDKVKSILKSPLVVVCYILALASKQTGIVLPLLLGLYEISSFSWILEAPHKTHGHEAEQKFKNKMKQVARSLLPLIVVTLIYLGFRYFYLGGIGDLEGFQQIHESMSYLSVQGMVILKYIQLTFIPVGLTIDHGILPNEYSGSFLFFCWTVVVAMGILGSSLIRTISPTKKIIGFGILFYLAVVLPTSLLPTVDCLVERRVYLANFGLLIVASSLFRNKSWVKSRNWKISAAICLLLLYFVVSFKRNEVFASERQIWEESLSSYPGYSRALINAAWIFVTEKEYERGEEILKIVLKYMPNNTEVLAKLGTLYGLDGFRKKDPNVALSYFQQATQINPGYFIGRYLAANVLVKLRRLKEAKETLQKVIETNKNYSPAYLLLGRIAEVEKDPTLAQFYFKSARQIDPQDKPF